MSRSLRILALLAALLVLCVVAGSSLIGQAPTSRALGPIAEEFQEMPSDYLLKAHNDVKLALPKAVADANAFLIKAMTLSQVLKKHDITLNVPAPVK